jgi:hypothetical protein
VTLAMPRRHQDIQRLTRKLGFPRPDDPAALDVLLRRHNVIF